MLAYHPLQMVQQHGENAPWACLITLADSIRWVVNLEAPLTTHARPWIPEKPFVFQVDPRWSSLLSHWRVTGVTVANNHILDYGWEGWKETRTALQKTGIPWVGLGDHIRDARRPLFLQVDGYRVGILAYSLTYPERYWAGPRKGGTAFGHLRWIQKDITKTREKADFVVVIFHWGRERWPILRPYQRTLAHAAIDAGADLVVGHHPHVLQPVERYHGHTVVYSLGNLLFGSSSLRPEGAVLLMRLEPDSVRFRYIPLEVRPPRGGTQPYPLPEPYRTLTLQEMLPRGIWSRIPFGAEWTEPWSPPSVRVSSSLSPVPHVTTTPHREVHHENRDPAR